MSKSFLSKIGKRIIQIIVVNVILYFIVCFVLVYWPAPEKKEIKNYDFSSIDTSAQETGTAEEHWISMRDGKKLFMRLYPGSSKEVMILIHGSGTESRYLKELAQNLADSQMITVITPDLRGHGASEGQRGDIDYIGQLEDDIEDIIAYSKEKLGAEKIILAGHSSGGGFVLRFIGNSTNTKIDRAILLAPYLGYKAPTVKANSGNWVTVAVKRWVGISMLNRIGIKTCDALPVLFFNLPKAYSDSLQVSSYSYRMAVNLAPEDYKKDIEQITIPCLVLVGGKDESFYPDQFKVVFEPAKNFVKTDVLSDVNHLNIVKQTETMDQIRRWLIK
ncbi:alpha/beta hydrolase [Cytophaga aurantiaca]|uniref:alpha/beta hydrolase n=1 Tax=Cytophaga aurantiaca TaxID=29530 RepID=UPI00036C076E|nr:alpha/beta hydrolase [Cytophaga aurantiaca]